MALSLDSFGILPHSRGRIVTPMKTFSVLLVALGIALATPFPASADAAYGALISKLPAVIKKPGVYRLSRNLSFNRGEGTAISIQADNVTLDLGGRQLTGAFSNQQGGNVRSIAVSGTERRNVTICNGTISGFDIGVKLDGTNSSRGNCVRDLVVQDCAVGGVFLEGSGCVVENSRLQSIGSVQTGTPRPTYGIWLNGDYGLVQRNRIANIYNSNSGAASYPVYGTRVSGQACILCENAISAISNPSGSPAVGAIVDGTSNTIIIAEGNRINGVKTGIEFGGDATGVYRNNTVYAASNNTYVGGSGVNGGGNY